MGPLERPIFGPRGIISNKLGRDKLDDATYQISRLKALWFQTRRFFHVFTILSLCKICDPWGGANFNQGNYLNKLGRGPLGDATYPGSRPCGFRQEDFFTFSLYKPM